MTNARADRLKRFLIQCSYWYYVKAAPLIEDRTFDTLVKELGWEESNHGPADPDSPTQIVYGDREAQYPEWAKATSWIIDEELP